MVLDYFLNVYLAGFEPAYALTSAGRPATMMTKVRLAGIEPAAPGSGNQCSVR